MSFTAGKIELQADPALYHAVAQKRGATDYPVSSSMLRAFGGCPARWIRGYEPPETEAKEWGSLLDCVLLTPRRFDDQYAVRPATYTNDKGEVKPWNSNSNTCKAWIKDAGNRKVITAEELAEAKAAAEYVLADEILAAWHNASEKQVLVTGAWKDDRTKMDVPVRCLIDYVPKSDSEFASCLGDLKTTRNAAGRVFSRWCYTAGYHVQAAFNIDLWNAVSKEARDTFCLVLSENYAPWQVGRRMLSQEMIQIGRLTYQHALSQYCRCLKTNNWPGYDDTTEAVQGWQLIHPEPWMEYESASAAIESDQSDAVGPLNEESEMPS